jgi:hypothetical protein
MTDSTPHESLPLDDDTQRQFFRLVSNEITVWYASHSTPSPFGISPPESVEVLNYDKFAAERDPSASSASA